MPLRGGVRSFSFSFLAEKEKENEPKERENSLSKEILRSFNQKFSPRGAVIFA